MVKRDFDSVPTEWVKIVANEKGSEIFAWPMWGTMWIVSSFVGEQLMENSIEMTPEEAGEQGYNEEMDGARNVNGTAAYIYEIDGIYVMGIHGAGWDFYDGVWDKIYDLRELNWHDAK